MLQTRAYQRKPFVVQAVQVTRENMSLVVQWCGGTLCKDEWRKPYIKVEVHLAANAKQTMAYAGDWVLISATGARVYTDYAFNKSFEPVGDEVDPQKQSQNIFETPGVDREEVVEKPVGNEKVVQGESVEKVVEKPVYPTSEVNNMTVNEGVPSGYGGRKFSKTDASTALPASNLFRAPEEIREAHRTSGPRTADEISMYREAFRRQHGRYPGEEPGTESFRGFSPEGREAFRRLYGRYPEDSVAEGHTFSDGTPVLKEELEGGHPIASDGRISTYLEDYRAEQGHYPGENVDSPDA